MVQWLGLSILTAKAQVQSLVGEGSQKKKKSVVLEPQASASPRTP